MKSLNNPLVVGAFTAGLLVFSSCAPMYTCGDPIPEKTKGSKRLQAIVVERDLLCMNLSQEQATNSRLMTDKKNLEMRLTNQENITDNQADQFGKELGAKSKELQNKERLLREMQAIIERQDKMTSNLNNALREALLGFTTDELSVEIRNGKVYVSLSDKLLFKSGSDAVETKGVEALKVLADVLNKNPDVNVLVEGHTDNIPIKTAIYSDNWDLSVARATSITRLLTEKYSVSPSRLTASGRGEFYPKAANDTQDGKAKNRRTEIILSPKLDEIMNLLNSAER